MAEPRQPADPLPGAVGDSVALHQVFLNLTEAGFTEDQALRLLALIVTSHINR